ncbi:cytochrome c oxidase subunit 3, partial [Phaffia rhodozyma]
MFNTALSAAGYFHGVSGAGLTLALGLFVTGVTMALWFRDVTLEATFLGDHTLDVQNGLGLVELASAWPPVGLVPVDAYALPFLNTVLLLSSGAAITYAHHALVGLSRSDVLFGLFITLLLAVVFTYFQAVEYADTSFTLSDGVFGSTFYMATGTHGFHVIVGSLFIAVGGWRIYRYHLTSSHHKGFESSILYWHMVDVVW